MATAVTFKMITYNGVDVSVPIPDFSYRPLDTGAREIRLLEILPETNAAAPIKATVTHYSLDDVPFYTALSYQWGDPSICTPLNVNDTQFPVTINLEKALQQIRTWQYPLIWIDSICINQNDKAEKNSQIMLMKDIYYQADCVAVWLGEAADGSDTVMQMLEAMELSRSPEHGREKTPWTPNALYIENLEIELKSFLHRTYWRRVWIIQEISLSSKAVVCCGPATVHWKAVELLSEQLHDHPLFSNELDLVQLGYLCNSRLGRVQGRSVGLLKAILDSHWALATDPRDKVYALLGLTFDHEQYVKQPHSEWSTTAICLDITRNAISAQRSLDIIFHAFENADPSLPSWCPNYFECSEVTATRSLLSYLAGLDERFRAGQKGIKWRATNDSLATRDVVRIDHNEYLHTRGARLAAITGLGYTLDDPPPVAGRDEEVVSSHEHFDGLSKETLATYSRINRALALYDSTYPWTGELNDSSDEIDTASHCAHIYYYLYSFDRSMVEFRSQIEIGEKKRTIQIWRERNKDFQIQGKGLRKRAHGLRAIYESGEWRGKMTKAAGIMLNVITQTVVNVSTGNTTPGPPLQYNSGKTLPSNLSGGLTNLASIIEEGMSIMTTDQDHVGWAHPNAQVTDEIFLLTGCSMPVVLRPKTDGTYTVIGHAYVEGVMNGEFWSKLDEDYMQSIQLV